ncbi:MAG: succinylglutamate desuccinylase/aspartoacylase family protein [Lachnospiraceae bacterium]|nr:succinylglutamate desuccinylase/aspartoacylase family protein [Lachnospiraceae bacterium]
MTLSIKTKHNVLSALILLALAAGAIVYLSLQFTRMWTPDPVYEGKNPSVKEVRRLSDYNENLKGSKGDTNIYVIEGDEPGDSMLILGGVHANEPAGMLAAVYLVENLHPKAGTVYVIPYTNEAGFTCNDPLEASPMFFSIDTPTGPRQFRFGARVTNPVCQWPDPDIYVHASSGQRLAGSETRNLNRTYPGRTNGTFTEQISYGLVQLIKAEDIAVTIDLHEASPEYQTINTTVAESRAMKVATTGRFNMDWDGITMSVEQSPTTFHGLSHIELGTWTDTLALLMETSNPSQGREHGLTGSDLVIYGKDKFYARVKAAVGLKDSDYSEEYGRPIQQRVARHITAINAYAAAYTEEFANAAAAEDKLTAFTSMGLGASSYPDSDGHIIYEGRRGVIDLGELPSYDTLCTDLFDYLAIPEGQN